ncbi:hypothetical protein [Anaerofustis sp.]|uniref:hypothetical protein n=1 Tax=Anaerofustis sp. TaxID=1872517 RepID=UPI0025B94FB0|nr:hypothetical protein [Anaerofustis sp.]
MYRICKECGKPFFLKNKKRLYCSDSCRDAYHNKLKSEIQKNNRNTIEKKDENVGWTDSLCEYNCFECPYGDCIKE